MKKTTVIPTVILLTIILLIILVATIKGSFSINIGAKNSGTSVTATVLTQSESKSLETKESANGPVSIAVTPRSLEEDLVTWDFAVVLDTHSEELSSDMVAVSELVDDEGKSYKPVAWEGSPAGGHHRSGVLKFNSVSPKPKSVELKVRGVGGVAERSFKWVL